MKKFKDKKTGDVYAYSADDLAQVANLTEDTPQVFHDIAEKLKGMTELKGEALRLHLNPLPTADGERAKRDGLLLQVDAYASNPLRWADTSQENKDAITAYRQALLDVPQQVGFPESYVMTTIPEWL